MKLIELLSIYEARPGDGNTSAWYIVHVDDDAVSAGPYDTLSKAKQDAKRLTWFNDKDFSILYGVIDTESKNDFDTFVEISAD